jgi:DNA-binding winged helix-turn-helix (wHTH) protein
MPACLRCGSATDKGLLCAEHAGEIGRCREITAEQIDADVVDEPAAWLVDQWGCSHPIGALALIGRSPEECTLRILHSSISAVHAQLELRDGAWRLLDRGSLNGSFVNRERVRNSPLRHLDRVGFGDVCLYFSTTDVPPVQVEPGSGRTVPLRSRELLFAVTIEIDRGRALEMMQRIEGGVVRVGDKVVELARLEFGLLQELAERRRTAGDADLAFVPWQELSRALRFKTRGADSENVRELVSRVRRKLKSAGVTGLIESRQGVGYRLCGAVIGGAEG